MALLLLLLCLPAQSDSLLPEDPQDLFAPLQIRVGDLVTVVVRDDARTVQQVNVANEASSKVTNPIAKLLSTVTGIEPTHDDEKERREIADTRSQFSETVTATVTKVERGNLSLEASRVVSLDGKKRTISLTGKVRRRDVGADNRVSSQLLADAVLQVEGLHKSPVKSGILSRVLRILF